MNADELFAQYEATGDEEVFLAGQRQYERALAASPDDADVHINFGYLLECHARNQLRQAAAHYERAIELNSKGTKAHYHLIGARAGLLESERANALYEKRLAATPDDVDSYRLLAAAYLAGHQYEKARRVIEAGIALAPNDAQLIENRGDAHIIDWSEEHGFELDTVWPRQELERLRREVGTVSGQAPAG